MQRTWTEENLRLLNIIRNSELYPILEEDELSNLENISRGIGTKTEVYSVGRITDIETGNPIYVALKQIFELPGFIIAYHEFLDRLGFPVPAFAGGIKRENKGYCVTEDLTLGSTVKLFERNFEDDEFPKLANKEQIEREFQYFKEIVMDLYPNSNYHRMDFVRAFYVQIDNKDVGRLVVGDVTNIPQSLDLTLNNEYMKKIMKRVGEINQDPRYFL